MASCHLGVQAHLFRVMPATQTSHMCLRQCSDDGFPLILQDWGAGGQCHATSSAISKRVVSLCEIVGPAVSGHSKRLDAALCHSYCCRLPLYWSWPWEARPNAM